jgi:hypothetical protein
VSPRKARGSSLSICDVCHRAKRFVSKNRQLKKLVCPACYVRTLRPRLPCVRCGRIGVPTLREGEGAICKNCYQVKIAIDTCARCTRLRPVYRRYGAEAICEPCSDRYFQERISCVVCGRSCVAKVSRFPGGPVCGACYRRTVQPTEECSLCFRDRIVAVRLRDSEPVCPTCYLQVMQPGDCALCGTTGRVLHVRLGFVCLACFRTKNLSDM